MQWAFLFLAVIPEEPALSLSKGNLLMFLLLSVLHTISEPGLEAVIPGRPRRALRRSLKNV